MLNIPALCVVIVAGAGVLNVSAREALSSELSDCGYEVVVECDPEKLEYSLLNSFFAVHPFISPTVRLYAVKTVYATNAPKGNTLLSMRRKEVVLPTRFRLWPGHLYRRRCTVPTLSA